MSENLIITEYKSIETANNIFYDTEYNMNINNPDRSAIRPLMFIPSVF